MMFSLAVMFVLLVVILSADIKDSDRLIAAVLAALMLILIPVTYLSGFEEGREVVLESFCTQYTKTELYNMSDAEKDLLPKTYGGATTKYWNIDDKKKINEINIEQ